MISICSYKREHLDPSDLHVMEKRFFVEEVFLTVYITPW